MLLELKYKKITVQGPVKKVDAAFEDVSQLLESIEYGEIGLPEKINPLFSPLFDIAKENHSEDVAIEIRYFLSFFFFFFLRKRKGKKKLK